MNKSIQPIIYLLLLGILIPVSANSQTDLDYFRKTWEKKKYNTIIEELPAFRDTTQGMRKEPLVHYYLATSYCRTQGATDLALRSFQTLRRLTGSSDLRKIADEEMAKCFTREDPPIIAMKDFKNLHGNRSTVSSKIFSADDGEYKRKPVEVLRSISPDVYRSRLFGLHKQKTAIRSTKKFFKKAFPEYKRDFDVFATSHFLLVGIDASSKPEMLEYAGNMLENTLAFYQRAFGMKTPAYLMTIYLPVSSDQAVALANKLHGLQIDGLANLGYTSHEDQTIVSQTPEDRYFGTLNHELFHLLAHQFFGDIPAWMDEGIAALYEKSQINNDGTYIGLDNWRGPILNLFWDLRPSIEQLTTIDWYALEAGDFSSQKEGAIFATARYFFYYLQENQKLAQVYRTMQQLTPETMQEGPLEDAQRVLEDILGMDLVAIDAAFAEWVRPKIGK